jgi:pimeloyl-ACP methyl ester carboxylesterase
MAKQNKPSIVFAHGLWADGSCFQKLIPPLQADGHEVMCSQHGLDSLKGDVQCVTRCFGRVSGPVVLVGHSYGGTLITHAGMWATQAAPVPDLFNQKVDGVAWQSKPSWYIVATEDQTIQPELERFVAKRMGATTVELRSSHVPMLSQPQAVLDVIRTAAKAIQKSEAA